MRGLTPRQARLVNEYLVDLNGTQAAIRAGYSRTSASQVSAETMAIPRVKKAIAERIADRAERLELRQDAALLEVAKLAFSNIADYIRFDHDGEPVIELEKCTREQLSCIQEITTETRRETGEDGERTANVTKVRIKLYDRLRALEATARHLGMDKQAIVDPDGRAFGMAVMDRLEIARRLYYVLRHGKPPIEGQASPA